MRRTKAELERALQELQTRERRLLLSRMRVYWQRVDENCMKTDALLDVTLEQFILMHRFGDGDSIELGNGIYLLFDSSYEPRVGEE